MHLLRYGVLWNCLIWNLRYGVHPVRMVNPRYEWLFRAYHHMESYGTILWVLNLRDGPHRLKNIKDYKEIKDLEDAKRHRIAVFAKSSGSLPHRLSGHRNGSRSRNGFLVWYRHINYTTQSNSHCDVKSRGVRERPKCMLFSIEKAAPFVAQRCDAVIYPVFIYLSKCNSPDEES